MPSDRPVLPPPAADLKGNPAASKAAPEGDGGQGEGSFFGKLRPPKAEGGAKPAREKPAKSVKPAKPAAPRPVPAASRPARTRTAHLRLTRIDPLSVMKMAFLLSIALGIVLVVAVTIIWSVLSAVGVWDNINSAVQQVIGTEQGETFDVSQYVGTPRVIGFALIASVINVVLLTAIATLAAFVYNLAAALLGGVEMSLSEDR